MTGPRLLAVPASVARRRSTAALADALAYADAGAAVLAGSRDARAAAALRTAAEIPVLAHGGASWCSLGDDPALAAPGDPAHDPAAPALRAAPAPDALAPEDVGAGRRTGPTLLVCPTLAVDHDPTTLSSSLPDAAAFGSLAAALDGPLVVLAGGQPAGYHHRWTLPAAGARVEAPVHGLGATDDPAFTVLAFADDTVAAERLAPDDVGLRAVAGVGPATADRLREAGVETRSDLAGTPVTDLAALPGVGEDGARRMHRHVDVVASGDPLRTSNTALPGAGGPTPVCLDVETDGLTPSIVWQFGLYDPRTDEYVAVVEDENPTDPGPVVREFCALFAAEYADRPVLAWNGDGFDFPVVARFVRRHAPAYAETWAEARTVDLLSWARDNALLPGRTNRLDDVARALGHDGADTGLSGARTAAAYRAFAAAPDDAAAEPDWARHRRYCEDDCRALWTVYEALRDADRRAAAADDGQTGLTEFG